MRRLTNIAILSTLLALAPAALAQEEEDHATTSSGHDPNAEHRAPLNPGQPEIVGSTVDLDKTLGLGYGQTPGGVTGAELEYHMGSLMLDFHLGFDLISPKKGDSASVLAFAGGVFYKWKTWDNVMLMAGARLDIGHASYPDAGPGKLPQSYPGGGGSSTQFNLEGMLRAQIVFAGGLIGVHAEVGPVLAFISKNVGVLGESWQGEGKGVYLTIPNNSLVATFGAVVYMH